MIRTVQVTRYLSPLREGGSMPAIAEADDGFLYVIKFRGAGQGTKALIAELIGGELARRMGLRVPEIVFATLDAAFGRSEADEEIQDLLKFSVGLNLGLHYLSGAITYDPAVTVLDEWLASKIVWLDCLVTNMDRTSRNTNMLLWHKELWLIDHGAALYFHHSDAPGFEQASRPFPMVRDHVLLPQATRLDEVDLEMRSQLAPNVIREVVELIPADWLHGEDDDSDPLASAAAKREMYVRFLTQRIENSSYFIKEAQDARAARF